MHPLLRALIAGASGALATNALHETLRRVIPNAPRVDVLGMQALAKMYAAVGAEPPRGEALYRRTLVGDLVSNAAYFAPAGGVSREAAMPLGLGLGLAAGVGAAALPRPLGLEPSTTARTPVTALLSVALYSAGGVTAGFVGRRLARSEAG